MGSFDSLLYSSSDSFVCKSVLMLVPKYTKMVTSRCIHRQGVVMDTGKPFTDLKEQAKIYKVTIILKIDCEKL
jgi:hypothetical protein